ncbi:outer membrane beta-barrel protein [Spirosoma gilvum]
MNAISFMLTFLMPILVFGQQPASIKPNRASIGINVSPSLCYRTISATSTDALVIADRNGREISKWGYDAGVTISVPMSKRIALESGIFYVSRGYQTRPQTLEWPSTTTDMPVSSTTRFTYKFLSIPGKVTYTFGHSKLQGFVEVGLAMNVFIGQQVKLIARYADRQTESTSRKEVGVSRFSLFALVSAGIRYPVSPRMNVKLEPNFQYGVTPLRPGLAVREHLYSGGLTIGLSRRF